MITMLALDPGVTTGYAFGTLSESGSGLELSIGQHVLEVDAMYEFLEDKNPHYTICEDFEYRRRQRDNLELFSVQLIGVIRLWHMRHRATDPQLFMQKASQGKGYYSDEMLKRYGVYEKGIPHGRDATRHLLHWLNFGYGYQFNQDLTYVVV